MAWLARRDDGWEAAGEAVLRAEGIPCERVDATELFPSIAVDDVRFTLFEPEAGILRARDAVKTLAAQAVAAGAELVLAEARPDGAAVVLDDGRRLEADRVVWACGAWLAPLFPGVLELRITHQDVFYFGAPAAWRTPGVPGWVDYDGAAYGLGDLDGRGVKVSPGRRRAAVRPRDACERVAVPEHERLARAYLAHRFPALARRAARRPSRLPVRDHARHALRHGARTPTTTGACGCWAAARATASSTARRWPSASSRWLTGRRGARAALRPGRAHGGDVSLRTAGVRTA